MFSFETDILRYLESLRLPWLNALFEAITFLGEETLIVVLLATLWFALDRKLAHRLFFITASSMTLNSVIKNIVCLPRPFADGKITCVRQHTATGYSFPSGHTQCFTTWSTALASTVRKGWFWAVTAALIAAVGFSRTYLGAHYPSDVLVGLLLGVGCALLGGAVYDRSQNKQLPVAVTCLAFAPFAVWFLIQGDPLHAGMFKNYGLLLGLLVASPLQQRYAPLRYDVSVWKKALRVLCAVLLAFAVKEGFKLIDVFGIPSVSLALHTVRYALMVIAVLTLCPLLFKKIRL